MAEKHRYHGSTIKPGCCIVLLMPGSEELWDGKFDKSALLQRCGKGPTDEVHVLESWQEWSDAGH